MNQKYYKTISLLVICLSCIRNRTKHRPPAKIGNTYSRYFLVYSITVYNGRPLAFNNLIEKADAIFECWYPGQGSGNAVADILFGDNNPGAKLHISFPRSVGHIPVYYNCKPSARRGYFNADISPLYPFGFGLSYTTFAMSNVRLEKKTIAKNESVKVFVDVKNTGDRTGDEVVHLYIRDELSTVTRPIKELKDFVTNQFPN